MHPSDFTKESLRNDLPNYVRFAAEISSEPQVLRRVHAALGIAGEAGELTDIIKKSFMYGKLVEPAAIREECGDLLWYMAILLDSIDSSFAEVMAQNVAKLSKRYPNGFTPEAAIARADKQEQK